LRDEAGRQDDDDEHERHFDEFRQAFAEAWHQERHAYRAHDEARAKRQGKVGNTGFEGA
jgi:hypothetical protein